MKPSTTTYLELVAERYDEVAETSDGMPCLAAAVGSLSLQLYQLLTEVSRPPAEQDGEHALELLVSIGLVCAATAEDLIIPELRRED